MALSCKVDDAVDLLVLHELVERIKVTDIHPNELVVGLVLDIFEVGEVASICELVEVDDVIFGIFVHEKAYHMASDEACTACDDDISFHIYYFFKFAIHCLRDSVQYEIRISKVSFIFVLSRTE